MKNKKIPYRTCVLTKEKLPKNELLRIVRTPDKNIVIDLTGKINGRGAYIKKDIEVIKKEKINKQLSHQLECDIPDNIYDEIIDVIKNNN